MAMANYGHGHGKLVLRWLVGLARRRRAGLVHKIVRGSPRLCRLFRPVDACRPIPTFYRHAGSHV